MFTLVNYNSFIKTIINTNYLLYRLYNPVYVSKQNLEYIKIKPFYIEVFNNEKAARLIKEVVIIDINLKDY